MTRRDLQRAMGDEKKPWEIGKSFDRSAPMGPLHRVADVGHFTKGAITLKVNGVVKQSADLNMMTWSVAEQIAKLSQAFELFPGDLIYSGTPENVGPVVAGRCHAGLDRRPADARRESGLGRPAHRQPVDAQRRLADADRHALAFLAADADAGVELHVVADHADAGQRVGAVADRGSRP